MDECVTELLQRWRQGDERALEQLTPLVYGQLRRLAQRRLEREAEGHTLQPTALVHETYLCLAQQRHATFQDRTHFFAVAAQVMRRVLVDHARARSARKRGGALVKVALDQEPAACERDVELVRLDEAVERLAARDALQARIVELRYFAGLTVEETAEVLHSSPATVKREWTLARAWLHRELALQG